jgi:hypothetical protein
MYSVTAIFKSSIWWGLFEYPELGAERVFDHPVLVMLPKFISAQANQFAHAVNIWGFV